MRTVASFNERIKSVYFDIRDFAVS